MLKITIAMLTLSAIPAFADPVSPPAAPLPVEKPQPDLDKPITTTLRKVQAVVSAAVAQAAAQSAIQGAKADFDEMVKQATPAKP